MSHRDTQCTSPIGVWAGGRYDERADTQCGGTSGDGTDIVCLGEFIEHNDLISQLIESALRRTNAMHHDIVMDSVSNDRFDHCSRSDIEHRNISTFQKCAIGSVISFCSKNTFDFYRGLQQHIDDFGAVGDEAVVLGGLVVAKCTVDLKLRSLQICYLREFQRNEAILLVLAVGLMMRFATTKRS